MQPQREETPEELRARLAEKYPSGYGIGGDTHGKWGLLFILAIWVVGPALIVVLTR